VELSIVRELVKPDTNDLFLCGDAAQHILPKHQSFEAAGIEVTGRSSRSVPAVEFAARGSSPLVLFAATRARARGGGRRDADRPADLGRSRTMTKDDDVGVAGSGRWRGIRNRPPGSVAAAAARRRRGPLAQINERTTARE
jgi:hypothetical protein